MSERRDFARQLCWRLLGLSSGDFDGLDGDGGDFGLLCIDGGLLDGDCETGFGDFREGAFGDGFRPGDGGGAFRCGDRGIGDGAIVPGIRGGGIIPGIRGGPIPGPNGSIDIAPPGGLPFSPGRNSAGISPGIRGCR